MREDNSLLHVLAGLGAAVLLLLLLGAVVGPISSNPFGSDGCVEFTLCSVEAAAGPCEDSTNTDQTNMSGAYYAYTYYGTQSTGTYSCDVYSNDTGYTSTAADKQKLNSSAMTETNQIWSSAGLFKWIWAECSAIEAANTVTITGLACPL